MSTAVPLEPLERVVRIRRRNRGSAHRGDPPSPKGTMFFDAVEFVFGP